MFTISLFYYSSTTKSRFSLMKSFLKICGICKGSCATLANKYDRKMERKYGSWQTPWCPYYRSL